MKIGFIKLGVIITLFSLFSCVSPPKSGPALISGGTLVWSDEFDGDSLDLSKWNIETGTGAQYGLEGWGNEEKEFYKPENVIVKNGYLYLEARKDNDAANSSRGKFPYTSGKISTGGIMNHDGTLKPVKFLVQPGMRIEARVKSAKGVGLWPAFWMIGATSNNLNGYKALSWPRCGEVDILEIRGGAEKRLNSTIHYGPYWPENRYEGDYKELDVSMADEWHVIGVTWDANVMHFLLDGNVWYTVDLKQLHADNPKSYVREAYSAKSGFVINVNLAVGGQYIANRIPDDSIFGRNAPYEDRCFMIDWVRVYR
ncbi:MAG: glycoside hydrolase family 16 protein [Spirochaetaceae bacterium]|nr:glycoside hydrolase family 16 protein [Spirochaetaceae bacterium]